MDRLSALDASFLYGETPESPMHVAGLAIFEPPSSGSDVFAAFRDHLKNRLHLKNLHLKNFLRENPNNRIAQPCAAKREEVFHSSFYLPAY